MKCNQCGHMAEIKYTDGGTDEGRFKELWQCESCGATGRVTGDAGDPQDEWTRQGAVFNNE